MLDNLYIYLAILKEAYYTVKYTLIKVFGKAYKMVVRKYEEWMNGVF
ncbi:hypothetical protein AV947_gp02 [Podophage Lau218]|uniref:Putative phage protein n=2 Tax=Lauvirus lau218 TaxID=1465639 RepID=A0A060BQV7_9CAUD|nr:hypothetical protein AV947_gp02 [Podophage Lau218]AIA83117.1 putative phage protein [Podophage Lau218]AIA83165.1 putative phage protein [Lauvirus lau218]AIA83213.1 putative phage protein [Lauvirus lau218]